MKRVSAIPSSKASRLRQFGRLAGGLAAGMAAEGVRRLASGDLPNPSELLLTPQNAMRLAERLSELRGAAMKVGQLLSMEAGDLLPRELSDILAHLREDAHQMPMTQVADVLDQAWGEGWTRRFTRFHFQPLAAASIGQVHEAVTHDGQRLAVKIQYPGIGDSIDADVNNVARLLTLVRALPEEIELDTLLNEAKRQLHLETDYLTEARQLEAYRAMLGDNQDFVMPEILHGLTTREVLAMTFVPGESLESLELTPRPIRNRIVSALLSLSLREVFEWNLVQTDPNFANYRYDRETGRIGLLDFGAVRDYPREIGRVLRGLLRAGVREDHAAIDQAAMDAGYVHREDTPAYREAIRTLLIDATEPARASGGYDFAASDLAARMSEKVMRLRFEQQFWRLPPTDLLYLHRKLGGLYMLCTRLRARVQVHRLVEPYLAD